MKLYPTPIPNASEVYAKPADTVGVKSAGTLSIAEISSWSGVNRRTVSLHLNRLVEQGKLERTAPLRSPKQRFRLKI